MADLFDTVASWFEADGWLIQRVYGEDALRTGFLGEHGQFNCFARVRAAQHQFVFYSTCALKAPKERRAEVAEFITRANYGMLLGNFELDYDSGEVRYKTSVDVEDDRLSAALVRQVVIPNVMMMDRYLPGLIKVIKGTTSATGGIAEVEGY